MSRAVLSIGSNQGDRLAYLQLSVDQLSSWLVGVSPVFRTPPWGPVAQEDYYNAVLVVQDVDATPYDWLERAQGCERAAGRTREVRWGARTLDVDVVTVDAITSDDPALTLPHPRAAERAFVLAPWWALDPEAMLAGISVLQLLNRLPTAEVTAVSLVPGVELRR